MLNFRNLGVCSPPIWLHFLKEAVHIGDRMKNLFTKREYEIEVEGWGTLFKVGVGVILILFILQAIMVGSILLTRNAKGERMWQTITKENYELENTP
jgi:hypothetical protein